MEARRLIDNASYGPEALKALSQAFEEAWAEIEGNFGCDQSREAARVKLATALLSVASDESRDVELFEEGSASGNDRGLSLARLAVGHQTIVGINPWSVSASTAPERCGIASTSPDASVV